MKQLVFRRSNWFNKRTDVAGTIPIMSVLHVSTKLDWTETSHLLSDTLFPATTDNNKNRHQS